MATFLNLVGLCQHHHLFFRALKNAFPLESQQQPQISAFFRSHIVLYLLIYLWFNSSANVADLDSMPKVAIYEIKLESTAMGPQKHYPGRNRRTIENFYM